MKKIIALLLAMAIVFSMCACGSSVDNDNNDAQNGTEQQNTGDGSETRTITDMLGREVKIPAIVTNYAANSNEPYLLSYAGAVEGYLIGYRDTDASLELLYPGITGYDYVCFPDGGGTVDQEALIECDPDIVLIRTNDVNDERIAQIENCGLPVVCCYPPNSEGVMDFYELAAEIFGGEIAEKCNELIDTYYDALTIYDGYEPLEDVKVLAIWSMSNGLYRLQGNTAETIE